MRVITYADAASFFRRIQAVPIAAEAANSLMLGICRRLADDPTELEAPPCLKTVEDEDGLLLAAMMTPPHKLVVYPYRGEPAQGVRALLEDLLREEWHVPGILGPGELAANVATHWMALVGGRCERVGRLRVYDLRQASPLSPTRGRLRPATQADLALVSAWSAAFHRELFGEADPAAERRRAQGGIERGDIYLWEDGRPVSMAMKVRPTAKGISVSLVYTPPACRGRGYATACVGALSRLLLDSGWEYCALFAERANAAANRVYQKIGYRPVCDYDEYAFGE